MSFKVHINGVERDCTPEEEAEILARQSSANLQMAEQQKENVRQERNRLLSESDWIVNKAVEQNAQDGLGIEVPQVWLNYRQALRDIPQQDGFPLNVIWPDKPN